MPKGRRGLGPAITYTCDICNFKVTNNYIFKRHLHRCYTLHGIASKRSTARHPIRLKGTDCVKSVGSGKLESQKEESQPVTAGQINVEKPTDETDGVDDPVRDLDNNGVMEGVSQSEENDLETPGTMFSSQWSVKDSPTVVQGNVVTQDEDDDDDDDDDDESRIVSLNEENEMDDTMDSSNMAEASFHDDERSQTDSPVTSIMKARFERKYQCEYCSFNTTKSREHLYHLRDVHNEKVKIFECTLCDYASRYNTKLIRHMAVHKKFDSPVISPKDDGIVDQNVELGDAESQEIQELKVKPLKLKRLHVKTPSMFQVTHESKLKKRAQASPPMGKDVFKMVLLPDGSHDYQCRACLFYANTALSVKKHYSLCHSKLLQCGLCNFNTRSQAEYYEHIITHDGRITYHKCPHCSYVTHAKPTFENHLTHHGSEAPFKCRVCNFAADTESKVKRHMATQHTNKSGDPDTAPVGMGGQQEFLMSVGEGGSFLEESVETQDHKFEDTAMMMNVGAAGSMVDMESKEPSIMKPKKQLIRYKCPHCMVVCLRRANLTRHLVAKHDYNQKQASMSSKSLEKQLFRKRSSQKSYSSSLVSSAAKFIRSHQIPAPANGQEDLQCSECSYTAKWPSDLRRHMQVHTMVKRFKCPICTSKYKYLGDLNVHMRRDHLMEPLQHTRAEEVVSTDVVKKNSPAVFRCPICAYATSTKADLEQHTRQHGDIEKTFQCRLCDYQTYWRGDVGRHLFRHHKISLSKDAQELEKYFIVRPDIRPLTKMPLGFKLEHGIEDGNIHDQGSIIASNLVIQPTDEKVTFKNVLTTGNQPTSSGKEGTFTCTHPTCEYRTTTMDKLEIHMAQHENIKLFKCPTCGKRANYKWDIVKHMVKVHKNPSAIADDVIVLSVQEARESIGEYLAGFERKVVESPIYRCSVCDFKSGEKGLIVQHLDERHPEKEGFVLSFDVKQESAEVGDRKRSESEDQKVVRKFVEPSPEELAKYDKPYACGICKKAELTLPDIQRHYNYAHPYKEVRVIYSPDGTEFDMNTLEIYPTVKKSAAAAENFLGVDESVSPQSSGQTSPGKTIRPESRYSNPKMHGYIKPFKCSVCGLRSNWKWDLKKHLRSKHPHDGGFVIMLSIEEAQMTYGKECSRSHPKCESQTVVPEVNSEVISLSPDFKDSYAAAENEITVVSKNKLAAPPSVGTNFEPGRRQWKCSGCDYITNWRRNMARHMNRRHRAEKHQLRVIALHMLSKDEQDAILEERRDRLEEMGKVVVDLDEEQEFEGDDSGSDLPGSINSFSKVPYGLVGSDGKLWKCPKCSYHSTLRTHIIVHMQKHELRPFLCGVCNAPFMNRSPLHSHIQKIHKRGDYIKQVKVNIRYDGVIDKFHMGMVQQKQEFQCILCKIKLTERSAVFEHLTSIHGVEGCNDYITVISTASINQESYPAISNSKLFAINGNYGDNDGIVDSSIIRRKVHNCRLCPYTTQKKAMLAFHMTYHKPTASNRFKCKYCPYYVSTTRLLHHHQRKWHSDNKKIESSVSTLSYPASMMWEYPQSTPPHSPSKARGGESGTPRRHACEKCPYTTNCKNDFYYHKQFHRPKRSAEYKCEHCDYWVVHKRLLKQHLRLHEQDNSLQELSPAKSVYSDPGQVYDPVELTEIAALKQNMISAKILPSLSKSPKVSPMKIASQCAVDGKPGYVLKNGLYRKLHKCPKCPYTNTRARNMNLHIMMHGPRESSTPLMRCPYCDYYVGSKGLLSHHMKVHQKQYGDTPENDARRASLGLDEDEGDDSDDMMDIQAEQKVDTLLPISRMKRFGCEKCPYASAKRQHFERHLELHGSRQRYTCQYCDYSVPSSNLLTQHSRLHLMPNQNLLSCQSINNLQHVGEVPADVALAAALPPSDLDMSVTISVIHDHLGLYENSIYDPEQKKLYRCDRCPYANVRRDHLLSHLKFHMVSSSLVCPYCDYSAPKQALLTQHIRVHFCPLPELSDWLLENGQTERENSQRNIDMAEALKVAKEYQSQSKKKAKEKEGAKDSGNVSDKVAEKENIEDKKMEEPDPFICQYCDREFVSSEKLVKHELQHLIGNQFEMALKVLKTKKAPKDQKIPEPNQDLIDAESGKNDNSSQNEKLESESGGDASETKNNDKKIEQTIKEVEKEQTIQEGEKDKMADGSNEKNEDANQEEMGSENDDKLTTETNVVIGSEKEEMQTEDKDVEMKEEESCAEVKAEGDDNDKEISGDSDKTDLDLDNGKVEMECENTDGKEPVEEGKEILPGDEKIEERSSGEQMMETDGDSDIKTVNDVNCDVKTVNDESLGELADDGKTGTDKPQDGDESKNCAEEMLKEIGTDDVVDDDDDVAMNMNQNEIDDLLKDDEENVKVDVTVDKSVAEEKFDDESKSSENVDENEIEEKAGEDKSKE